jgi:hypothetical protein
MTKYAAQIIDNIVEDVIVANYEWAIEKIGGEWVDCTDGDRPSAGIGFTYDPETKTFIQPSVEIQD